MIHRKEKNKMNLLGEKKNRNGSTGYINRNCSARSNKRMARLGKQTAYSSSDPFHDCMNGFIGLFLNSSFGCKRFRHSTSNLSHVKQLMFLTPSNSAGVEQRNFSLCHLFTSWAFKACHLATFAPVEHLILSFCHLCTSWVSNISHSTKSCSIGWAAKFPQTATSASVEQVILLTSPHLHPLSFNAPRSVTFRISQEISASKTRISASHFA